MGGKKVALIVGINYTGTENELSGCINDAKNMEEFLLKNGYNSEDITLLTDDTQTTPTKENILIELYKMIVSDAKYIFFHFIPIAKISYCPKISLIFIVFCD